MVAEGIVNILLAWPTRKSLSCMGFMGKMLDPNAGKIQSAGKPPPPRDGDLAGFIFEHDVEHLGAPSGEPDLRRGGRRRRALDALARWHWLERSDAAAAGRKRRSTMEAGRALAARRTSPALTAAELAPLVDWIEREERIEEATEAGLDPRFIAERLGCTVRTVEASQERMRWRVSGE